MHDANNGIIYYLKSIKAQYRVIENSMDGKTEATIYIRLKQRNLFILDIAIVACIIPVNYLRPKQIFPKIQVKIEYFLKRKKIFLL